MNDFTRILSEISRGSLTAADDLLPLVYRELRRLAAQKMGGEKSDLTIDATGLVHEAYIRLVDVDTPQQWNGRGHFYSAAAEAMRRILIESARRRSASKRGSDRMRRIPLHSVECKDITSCENSADRILALDAALLRLAMYDPKKAKLVELRYFGGLTIDEAAESLQISTATANRLWAFTRAWLQTELQSEPNSTGK